MVKDPKKPVKRMTLSVSLKRKRFSLGPMVSPRPRQPKRFTTMTAQGKMVGEWDMRIITFPTKVVMVKRKKAPAQTARAKEKMCVLLILSKNYSLFLVYMRKAGMPTWRVAARSCRASLSGRSHVCPCKLYSLAGNSAVRVAELVMVP